jgi:DNA-binding MarR family transcriptional regulator
MQQNQSTPIARVVQVTDRPGGSRDDLMRVVYSQMETISRRAIARNRRTSAPLTVVQHTLLTFIAATPRCRSIDIAQALRLNRSTISRQVADLVELDLIQVADEGAGADAPGRGHILTLSRRGAELLEKSLEANHRELERRLASWTDEEIEVLASGLERFNEEEQA